MRAFKHIPDLPTFPRKAVLKVQNLFVEGPVKQLLLLAI